MDQSVLRKIDDEDLAAGARANLYTGIHKALRMFMCDTLLAVGRADPFDTRDVDSTLEQVRGLLEIALSHLEHENRFMHTAMEACSPGSSYRTADDHVEHLESLEVLRAGVARVQDSPAHLRPAALGALYRRLARFVAENFEHMEYEESHNMPVLWGGLADAQLQEIHDAILASIPPQEMAVTLHWLLPALSHPERLAMLEEMRASAPAQAFEAALAIARERLSRREFAKLAQRLGVPAAPELVEPR